MLTSTTRTQDDTVICSLAGELDSFTAPSLHGTFARAGTPHELVVDMAGVTFVDSAGIAALAAGVRNLQAAGTGVVVSVPAAHMRRLLRSIGLDRLAPVVDGLVTAGGPAG
ncbi:MAG TPA: STAS domain-containing protein [Acidimicrobiales bacterium]|nr:STAS domain-containing protein [Acidimicrobiales bacterium]